MRIRDIMQDPRAHGFPPNHPPMRSFLGAPVKALGQIFGNIYLTEKRGAAEFSEEDEAAVLVLATQAGIAVENARLYEETRLAQAKLRQLEVFDERERIARELHDGVIQSLFAVGMGLQGTAALAADEAITGRIEEAVEEIDRAIRDLRNYIFGLRPGILADRHLDQALTTLAEEFQARSGRGDGGGRRRLGGRRAGVEGGRHRPADARGALQRRQARSRHHVPRHVALRRRPPRRGAGGRRRRGRLRPGCASDRPGTVQPRAAARAPRRHPDDPERGRGRHHGARLRAALGLSARYG